MDKRQFALLILRYWYLVEFLGQPSFPIQSKANREANQKAEKGKKKTLITVYAELTSQPVSVNDLLWANSEQYSSHPVAADEISLCIGKVERNDCVEYMRSRFGQIEESPETNHSKICVLGLKSDSQGRYIENSFNVSPILWGLARLRKVNGAVSEEELARLLSLDAYKTDMRYYESDLTCVEEDKRVGLPLTGQLLQQVYQSICEVYLKTVCGEKIPALQGTMIYRRYQSEDDKAKDTESFFHSDLSKSFYTNDLQMVIDQVAEKDFGSHSAVEQELLQYIVGPFAEDHPSEGWLDLSKRIDIRSAWSADELDKRADFFHRYLDVTLAPLGKWPSRYMPCLMQQLAINVSTQADAMFGHVFSVNGPPGTGKTTLLKEVIVHNIIERAKLLSCYADPDEAFVEKHYQDGIKKQHGYSNYCWVYFDFKDERMKDYGMLVASCNNAAVENITKELPDSTALLKGVTPSDDDAPPVGEGLHEVCSLFDFQQTENMENYPEWNSQIRATEGKDFPDIYFTKYANDLAYKKWNDWDRWGLISAPFGKFSNIAAYAQKVLQPLTINFYKNEKITKRKASYVKTVRRFQEQFSIVESLQKEIGRISGSRHAFLGKKQSLIRQQDLTKKSIADKQGEIEQIGRQIADLKQAAHQFKKEYDKETQTHSSMQAEGDRQTQTQNEIEQRLALIKKEIIELEDRRGVKDFFFGLFHKATQLSQSIDEQNQLLDQEKEKSNEQKLLLDRLQKEIIAQKKTCDQLLKSLDDTHEKEIQLAATGEACHVQIDDFNKRIISLQNEVDQEKETYLQLLNCVNNTDDILKQMTLLDDAFWRLYDSEKKEENTKAQVLNPWFTVEYNREREKLFYFALQLHKEFLLSSKCCASNFRNLLLLWGFDKDDEKKQVRFSERDRRACFSALLNTVFLLTPVLSTTFASAGSMLSDIRGPGEIGYLIIDEAGQAQPQMAVGALYRCRRALVVGDPKQVEPVVTDDMDAIKRIIRNDFNYLYQSKSRSVQEFADRINPLGAYFTEMELDQKTWVGCPLVVHRRCISPMYEISNEISYNNTMKQQTAGPKREDEAHFCMDGSAWINVGGSENDSNGKDHFVKNQGDKTLELILKAFEKSNGEPDLFVITPFTTVKDGIMKMVRAQSELKEKPNISEWIESHIGTVHTFQGKEAAEVIFLLGCDKNALKAVKWVNTNIVNVAVTRAKYRLYVIGDFTVWQQSPIMQKVKCIIDSHAIRVLKEIAEKPPSDADKGQVEKLLHQIPGSESLSLDDQIEDSLVATFQQALSGIWNDDTALTEKQAASFGMTLAEIKNLDPSVARNVIWSIKLHSLFSLLKTRYSMGDMDFSCCGILFCKAMELQLKKCLLPAFKNHFPTINLNGKKLENTTEHNAMIGIFTQVLREESRREQLATCQSIINGQPCDRKWWDTYFERLVEFKALRNQCCHTDKFAWQHVEDLLDVLFQRREFLNTMVGRSLCGPAEKAGDAENQVPRS